MKTRTSEWRQTLALPDVAAWTCIEAGRPAGRPFRLIRVRVVIADLEHLEFREERGRELTMKAIVRDQLELERLVLALEPDAAAVVREAWAWHLGRRLEVVVAAQRIAAAWGLTLHDHELAAEAGRRG